MHLFLRYTLFLILVLGFTGTLHSQTKAEIQMKKELEAQVTKTLEDTLSEAITAYARVGKVRIKSFLVDDVRKHITITSNEALSYLPLRPENVKHIYKVTDDVLEENFPGYTTTIISDGLELSTLIPGVYRTPLSAPYRRFAVKESPYPLVSRLSAPNQISQGLQNRHIAVWQSHGRYFNQTQQKWMWQRPVIFQTVEDLFTQAFVVPFLVPMLENAGANVLLPRERDTQINEVIVDNDKNSGESFFTEHGSGWKKGVLSGFANPLPVYKERENPFTMGTYLQNTTTNNKSNAPQVKWTPDIPETGNYGVYIAYKSLPNSSKDARYTVHHAGGRSDFSVNQQMGGGTWIYLGNFFFDAGSNQEMGVSLSAFSSDINKVVTADAVKIGGGMGNISRKRSDQQVRTTIGRGRNRRTVTRTRQFTDYYTSDYPRFTEGARYWLQWAGVPDSVYSRTEYQNDYSDDFQSRGFWVNYIAGGSSVLPKKEGLKIPIDMAFAMHSDAGINKNDSIIGTLTIYTVLNSDKKTTYENGISRRNARELGDMIQTQIVDDLRATFRADWNRRGLWNKNYSESRVGEVPTILMEILSHQNFADMRYGLDPRFRFTVSRSIYKAMLRYIALVNGREYSVQPLPVKNFSSKFTGQNEVELQWEETRDELEPTARADAYILYTRIDGKGFDNGTLIKGNKTKVKIETGHIYSFKVAAVNKGGVSFPGETLSVYRDPSNKPPVLIVNGFTRISGPQSFTEGDNLAGFNDSFDAGVPYLSDINYTGRQTVFSRERAYISDTNPGHGTSETRYENMEIAGNTFDFPYIHGEAIKAAGFSFVSTSRAAVEQGSVKLNDYKTVDLILGKERQIVNPYDSTKYEYRTFSKALRDAIESYTRAGGNIFISGSHALSDLVLGKNSTNFDKNFMEKTLKVEWNAHKQSGIGQTYYTDLIDPYNNTVEFYAVPNRIRYFVESPDVIIPADPKAKTLLRYSPGNKDAAIIYKEKYGVCMLGFPFETIIDENKRFLLMKDILNYFHK